MATGIYKLVDDLTGETLWVGQSVSLKTRYNRHINDLQNGRHSQQNFADWYAENRRTPENILMEILQICEPERLNELEGLWFELEPPRFYGQMPSRTRKWYLSEHTKSKISQAHKERIRIEKDLGVFVSSWEGMSDEGRQKKAVRNKETGFNSITAAIAGGKGAGRPKSAEQRRKASEAAKEVAKEILACPICERECKGKSALGRHMTVHS